MWDAFLGIFINVLLWIYQLVGNFGIAIILFTLLIRVVTHPLTVQQLKGAAAMQDLQKDPRYIEIQTKYKNDKEKLQQEQMKLYQELKINPFASCLPTLIQFPIIIGLYQSVIQAMATTPIELMNLTRHVYPSVLNVANLVPLNSTFLWMNLGQPERLVLPFLPFAIPVMAIVVVITTYFQSRLMSPPSNPGSGDQTAMMTNMMNIYMPLLMGWLAWTLASGLALYFLVSNVIGIFQYALLGKLNWKNLVPSFMGGGSKEIAKPAASKSTRPSSKLSSPSTAKRSDKLSSPSIAKESSNPGSMKGKAK